MEDNESERTAQAAGMPRFGIESKCIDHTLSDILLTWWLSPSMGSYPHPWSSRPGDHANKPVQVGILEIMSTFFCFAPR